MPKSAQAPVHVNKDLHGNTVRVVPQVDKKGRVTGIHVEAGPRATATDIKNHAGTVKLYKRHAGAFHRVHQLTDKLRGVQTFHRDKNGDMHFTKSWEARGELQKLNKIKGDLDRKLKSSSGNLSHQERNKLSKEVTNIEHQLDRYRQDYQNRDKGKGKGHIAAESNGGKEIDRSTTQEQWRAQESERRLRAMSPEKRRALESERRARNIVSQSDQPLENPLPNAAQHGHGNAWHGYGTTDAQQARRVKTGTRPDGSVGNPPGKASRFTSPAAQAEALGRGNRDLTRDLANGSVPSFTDPTTGRPTYVDPATGKPVRHAVRVSTQRPGGFGTRVVKQYDPVTGAVLRDPVTNHPLTALDPVPRNDAKVIWEYRPTTGDWKPVTYYPD